jgi:hypothetical protein
LTVIKAYIVFPFAKSEVEDKNIQNNDLACCFYWCEIFSLILKKNMRRTRLMLFEKMMKRFLDLEGEVLTEVWGMLHNNEPYDLDAIAVIK